MAVGAECRDGKWYLTFLSSKVEARLTLEAKRAPDRTRRAAVVRHRRLRRRRYQLLLVVDAQPRVLEVTAVGGAEKPRPVCMQRLEEAG